MSAAVFARGGALNVTFKVWGDPTFSRGGKRFPNDSTINGPWHVSHYDFSSAFTLEAALNGFWSDFSFDENRVKRTRALPDRPAFSKAWAQAVSKETALTIRVTLGEASGARFEWHDGAWHTSIDTRGKPTGIYEQIGYARSVKLGFSPGATPVYLDDIVVRGASGGADP